MTKLLFNSTQRLMARVSPNSLTGGKVNLDIAILKFRRELSMSINEMGFMIWLGIKMR